MTLDRFYPIFDDAEWLARMLALGVKLVQLRIKERPAHEIRRQIVRSKELCERHGAVLIVNDYWQAAIDAGCDFVHLGQEDLDTADIAALRKAGIRLGVSTHDRAELERGLALEPDYVALGPVYPTILKAMKWKEQGLERVTEWKSHIGTCPLVAIGGLTVERADAVFAAGADIVSVVTDITLHADPESRVTAWLDVTRNKERTT